MSYFLHILHSNKINCYYIGISQNREIRLEYYNKVGTHKVFRGAHYTKEIGDD
jgi:predicted GIY-YIG superfamily endonuclease